jgi:two-component system phosphate regulon response regulator PhoB
MIEKSATTTILVVDDEEEILELVEYHLGREGYRVITATNGETALRIARKDRPDLIVLDLMLPGLDGLQVCKILKNSPETKTTAVVMLTAKGEEADIVVGLELGADDYITKPFSPRVLTARIKSVLRRKKASVDEEPGSALRYKGLHIDPDRHEVLLDDKPVELTATEFRLLHFLAKRPGWVFTRDQIVDAVRGENYPVTSRSVDVHIVSLRKKLGKYGEMIDTVRGVGYRFLDPYDS